MKVKDLLPNEKNPRSVTNSKLALLKKALLEFGDLSGLVFNRKTRHLVGGHQRRKHLDADSPITIVKRYSKPTKTGTVAEGYAELKGERFSYREVYWDENKEKAANIAANKGAGDWDIPQLNAWLDELSKVDLDFDIKLTMFDADELMALPAPIEVSAHTRTKGKKETEDETPKKEPICKTGQVYELGTSRLKVGADERHFCDAILSRWERESGEAPVLRAQTSTNDKPRKNRSGNA